MQFLPTEIPGLTLIFPHLFRDERGQFVKTVHADAYAQAGLRSDFREEYYSLSWRGVLRGLHFQLPPQDHVKLVYCIYGRVLDVVVDLRRRSPSYGRHRSHELDGSKPQILYIPRGLAHGFYTLSEQATLIYKTTTLHEPDCDSGIRWDSLDIAWPDASPVVSERDRSWPGFHDFDSPFDDAVDLP